VLHQGILGLPGVVDDILLDHAREAAHGCPGGLVALAVAIALTIAVAMALAAGTVAALAGLRLGGILNAGVHVVVAIAVLGDVPGLLHQGVLAVDEVAAALADGVDTLDHLIGLVIGVLGHDLALVVAAVELAAGIPMV